MDPLEIQYALKKRGITQARLAVEANVSEMSISRVIKRKMKSDRLQRFVAAKLGQPVTCVFPDRYQV